MSRSAPSTGMLSPLEIRLGLTEPDRDRLPGLYRLNVIQTPAVRAFGFAVIAVLAALHNAFLLEGAPPLPTRVLAAVLGVYCIASWAALALFFRRLRRVHLGVVFFYVDILFFLLTIYATGGPRSWLIFLLTIRVADHRLYAPSRKRLRSFAHAPIIGYLAMLLYVRYVDHATFSWAAELTKASVFYIINLYLGVANALPLDVHRRVIETKSLVEELEKRTQELAEARARTQLVLNSAGEGILGVDPEGRATFVNPAAAELLGWAADDLLGRSVHALVHARRPDGSPMPRESCAACAALVRGEPYEATDGVFRRRDGTGLPVDYVSTPIRDAGGRAAGAVVVFKDATARREIERAKDEFISLVSHELRTPLTAVRGALGLLASGLAGEVPARVRHLLDVALSNADRLMRLLTDVLDYERLRSGKGELRPVEVDASELMLEARDVVGTLAAAAGVEVVVEPRAARLRVDADRIVQALTNLLSNAIKFSPAGASVHLGAELDGDAVVFHVRDEGRGIPEEAIERIFGRFEQVDASDSREKGGAGLGLAICRGIVERHGGRVWAESGPGRGSTFYIRLPGPGPSVRSGASATAATAAGGDWDEPRG